MGDINTHVAERVSHTQWLRRCKYTAAPQYDCLMRPLHNTPSAASLSRFGLGHVRKHTPIAPLSVPCIWGILQSPCRKSTAFSAKDHFAKVFSYSLFGYLCDQTCGLSDTSFVFYGGRCLWRVHPPERLGFALDALHRMDCCDPQVRYPANGSRRIWRNRKIVVHLRSQVIISAITFT